MNTRIKIIKESITNIKADAIVNAANEGLWEGGGVCGAIFKVAGSAELTKACQKIRHCDTGKAVITPGFKSKAKYIIHAVGPVYDADNVKLVGSQLYDAYKNSLILARDNNIHSIAFPLISAGIFGYPMKDAWKKALRACLNWEAKNLDYQLDIYFTILNDGFIEAGKGILNSLLADTDKPEKTADTKEERTKKLIAIFNDTAKQVKTNPILIEETKKSRNKNRLYLEEYVAEIHEKKTDKIDIEVVNDRTFNVASKYVWNRNSKVAALNLANCKHPGGGVLKGSVAQEEGLCRMSNLYQCLDTPYNKKHYYYPNRNLDDMGSDSVIYTPNVTVFKTDVLYSVNLEQKDWYQVNVLTCAAPRFYSKDNLPVDLIYKVQKKRIKNILEVAIDNDIDVLILGAFGCGAFNNPPEVVAKAFKELLIDQGYGYCFKKVIFAIIKDKNDQGNYEAFKEVMEEGSKKK